jgi:hypothetical protein
MLHYYRHTKRYILQSLSCLRFCEGADINEELATEQFVRQFFRVFRRRRLKPRVTEVFRAAVLKGEDARQKLGSSEMDSFLNLRVRSCNGLLLHHLAGIS